MDFDADFKAALEAQNTGRTAEAEQAYRAIVAETDHLASLHNLGVILERTGRAEEAAAVYGRAARAAPDDPRPVRTLAAHYRIMRDFAAAEPLYRRVLELTPGDDDAAVEFAMVLLAQGRFAEGWALNERRPPRQQFLKHDLSFPEWRGEPLAGKRLFVWREQGFGDQIMMARFLTRLGAAQITYAGPAALQRLFEQLGVSFMPFGQGRFSVPESDYWCLPQSLPARLGATPQTLPQPAYFSGRPAASGARIGVVWKGEAANANNRFRSLPPEQAQRLLALPGAVSLDPADSGAADFQATADLIAGLDLVISVDTATAHLAGAMGRPVWVMLARHANDWQWPREGASPWYPSARLFAQARAGDWAPVVDAVCEAARREPEGAGSS
ncbi:tetratricopeptide repeat protein [Phenylobacterium sp.]|uniref:tetratricopeptide repeat protein n=1 Tax=Phenylobacterium sp. TaxID=1871053 RepID=UPI002BBA654D|nr:tetratricopeptide repeat protein [Phenylobacterium sp.]HLZ75696.1 tetratricopeptide repeat protein [Phenylobacterium sp.]